MGHKRNKQYVTFLIRTEGQRKLITLIIIIQISVVCPFISQASFVQNEDCLQAVEFIYGLRIDDARDVLKEERANNPKNLYAVYLEQYCDAFDLLISGTVEDFKCFGNNYKERTKLIKTGSSDSDPWQGLVLAEMEFQYGLFQIKFGRFIKGATNCIGGYRKVQRNYKRFPNFIPNLKLTGTTNIILSNIPSGPRWIFELLGMPGNEKEGLEQLENYYESVKDKKGTQAEAVVLMGYTYRAISEEFALKFMQKLNPAVYNNPLASYVYGVTLHRNGYNDKAIEVLSSIDRNSIQLAFADIDYWLGKLKLFRLDEDAVELLESYFRAPRSDDYKKEVAGYISFYYLTHNNLINYNFWRHKVMYTGTDTRERDKKARILSMYSYHEFPGIVKANLLISGSYYSGAREELEKIDRSQLSGTFPEPEFYYLMGCSLLGSDDISNAIGYFAKAINAASVTDHFILKPAMQKQAFAYEKIMKYEEALNKYRDILNTRSSDNPFSKQAEKEARDGLKRIKSLLRS